MGIYFKPSLIGTIAVAVLCPLFIYLGFWQLGRGEQKHHLQEYYARQSQMPAIALEKLTDYVIQKTDLNWRHVTIDGQFNASFHVLLDNQTYRGRSGYAVFTPFEIANSHQAIWVNRGWSPLINYDRSKVPDLTVATTPQQIKGTLAPPPPALLKLGTEQIETLNPHVLRVQTFDLQKLTRRTGIQTLPYMLRLASEENRFVQEWSLPGTGEEKHYGYAFQWFSFAGAVVILYLIMSIKRHTPSQHSG